jgi:hypothetical protein
VSDRYLLRFVGRFVFAYEGNNKTPGNVTALAMRMTANRDLQFSPHRLFLTVPRSHVKTLGVRRADMTVFEPAKGLDFNAQLFIWDLEGHDAWPVGDRSGFTLAYWDDVPDVGVLASPQYPTKGKAAPPLPFNKDFVDPVKPPPGPVAFRVFFANGDFTPRKLDFAKKASFEPLGHGEPYEVPTEDVPDVIDIEVKVDGPLYLNLRRHVDGAPSSIAITPAESPSLEPLVVTVTNLCTEQGSEYDREFAAYYDVLQEPPHPRARLIPYGSPTRQEGADSACTNCSTVNY